MNGAGSLHYMDSVRTPAYSVSKACNGEKSSNSSFKVVIFNHGLKIVLTHGLFHICKKNCIDK
jgi:hypothetical protein